MKVCIIGDGLVSLTLAKSLIQKEISVDILVIKKNKKYDKSRTIGISKSNFDFFNSEIIRINKIAWEIKKIKIYTEKNFKKEILNFTNNNEKLFSMIKNYELQKILRNNLKKSKYVRFKSISKYNETFKDQYNLIINCETNHQITKKFFSNKIKKNYNSYAITTIINHRKLINNTAFQIFTKDGPLAFLPISGTQTAIVYSIKSYKKKEPEIKYLINKFNPIYKDIKINNLNFFPLKSSHVRKYYNNNILAFGDLLHKIHPLAGQGFNMSLRDIKLISKLIDKKINLGLEIDKSICHEFQKKSQDKNYLFSTGIDLIYELFNLESKIKPNLLSKSIELIGKNKVINSFFIKFADHGIRI